MINTNQILDSIAKFFMSVFEFVGTGIELLFAVSYLTLWLLGLFAILWLLIMSIFIPIKSIFNLTKPIGTGRGNIM